MNSAVTSAACACQSDLRPLPRRLPAYPRGNWPRRSARLGLLGSLVLTWLTMLWFGLHNSRSSPRSI